MKTLSHSPCFPHGITLRPWPILLILAGLLSVFRLAAQPSIGVTSYGGQITGMITVSDELVQQMDKDEEQLAAVIADNLKAYVYLPGAGCDMLNDSRQARTDAVAKVEYIGKQGNNHRYKYQIGAVSRSGIFHESDPPLAVCQPHQVRVKQIRFAPDNASFLRFESSFKKMGVAFLTSCDRTFEDYNFTAYGYLIL